MFRTNHLLKIVLFFITLPLSFSVAAQEKTPAFPGAEGFGRYTTGGRGGAVYRVTSLADDGNVGTFRWACEQQGARTIVFAVSGTIHLTKALNLIQGNVTIAGQSAPGKGVCVADYPFSIKANNVIIRYMRFRLGNNNVTKDGADGWDGLGGMDKENIIIDHCSVSWSIDECLSVYGVKNSTVQWCISSQSLQAAGHSKGAHGYGGNWGGSGVTYHHNLMAHHESRVPRLGPRYTTQLDERLDMRNNVFYNWAGNGCYGGEAMKVNIVNNYYKPGPGTAQISKTKQMRIAGVGVRTTEYVTTYPDYAPTEHVWGKYYVDGNVNPKYSDVAKDNWIYGMYNQIDSKGNDGTYTDKTKDTIRLDEPIGFIHVTTHSAEDAYNKVLDYAGCSKVRDSYDEMIISDTRNGVATYTGKGYEEDGKHKENHEGIINSQEDNKPAEAGSGWSAWPDLSSSEAAAADTDGDGMPDEWETENGLNPNNPDDGAEVGGDGYTNLERYLNSLVESITDACLSGGTVMGVDRDESDEPVTTEYELSPVTSDVGWTFSNGFSITTGKGFSSGSGCGINGIKYSRNEKFTINIPEGINIRKVCFTGFCNNSKSGDESSASYIGELNGNSYSSAQYSFPSVRTGTTATHTIDLGEAVSGKITFTPKGDDQSVFIITLFQDLSSGISDVTSDRGNAGRLYNLQGVEVIKPVRKGVYIRDGKKFILR